MALDGVPYSLLQQAVERHCMPNFQRLLSQGSFSRMNSVVPVVSSVAWVTFSTGVNPGEHGIFGFVERDPNLNYVILTSKHIQAKTLWRRLSEQGKRVIAINVPGTYPPEPINGIIIGDFLCPSLDKVAYPREMELHLREAGYVIDVDPQLAYRDRDLFLQELFRALKGRERLASQLIETEDWDFFMLHIMETDRLNHFFIDSKDDPAHVFHQKFWDFYAKVDHLIGDFEAVISDKNIELMMLSDHGFCRIESEIDVNSVLMEHGYLSFPSGARQLKEMSTASIAYSLPPGRIYLNRAGREAHGAVNIVDQTRHLQEIREILLGLKDSKTGKSLVQNAWLSREIYDGHFIGRGPDLIAHPEDGYDLKSGFKRNATPFQRGLLSGMHTYGDAFLYIRGHSLQQSPISIKDMAPAAMDLMRLEIPLELEGKSPLR
ncbi:alkaline phosphatase family protein [Candidatus Acetothermia bacterium]|nr:alkaline phosphatase family protein [Candidatus Acetothermia bacterium]MBI3643998.1 alkaline phosphatase family protein [Candidatus Acetothermia bacterium]